MHSAPTTAHRATAKALPLRTPLAADAPESPFEASSCDDNDVDRDAAYNLCDLAWCRGERVGRAVIVCRQYVAERCWIDDTDDQARRGVEAAEFADALESRWL